MAASNHFLDSLDGEDLRALEPALEAREVERNAVLDEVGDRVGFVYLPVSAILSVVTVMADGDQVESRTIGRESGYGLLHALGSRLAYERMLVQVAGRAWRLPVQALADRAAESPVLVQRIVQHAQATVVQATQAAACNALHSAQHKLCRWLLMTQDRLDSDIVPLTQEHLGVMLGVQRTTVSALASELQDRGVIAYAHGKIRILNRRQLEGCACECYGVMTDVTRKQLATPPRR